MVDTRIDNGGQRYWMSIRKPYPSDATGEEWAFTCPLLRRLVSLLVGRP
jgi:hypothetical protein